MDTDYFIKRIAETAEPISPLPPPSARSVAWLALALPYLVLVVVVMSPRTDLAAKLSDSRYLIEQVAAFATAVTAAFVAFGSTVPGFDRRFLLLPIVPIAVGIAPVDVELGKEALPTLSR